LRFEKLEQKQVYSAVKIFEEFYKSVD